MVWLLIIMLKLSAVVTWPWGIVLFWPLLPAAILGIIYVTLTSIERVDRELLRLKSYLSKRHLVAA